ncbi:DUF1254 domain-containing protein [Rhodococcus sp. NPDC055112]
MAPINQLGHMRTPPDPYDRTVVRTNQDTLYTNCWLDLSEQPMVLSLPAMITAATGGEPATATPVSLLLYGPGWPVVPVEGTTQCPLPTNTGRLIGRIELKSVDDETELDNVHALQDGMSLIPLSYWQSQTPYTPSWRHRRLEY